MTRRERREVTRRAQLKIGRARRKRDRLILRAVGLGYNTESVALAYGVSRSTVYDVIRGVISRQDFVWRGLRRRPGVITRYHGVPGIVAEAMRS